MAKSRLATAYVQVVPSMEGVAPAVKKQFTGVGGSAASTFASKFASILKGALAAAGIGELIKNTLLEGSELQQLKGGVEKIFNDMDTSTIFADAAAAYKNLNMSANEYLTTINDVGASFAATMGDEKGYQTAKTGLQAISDYASGTGKSVDMLAEKFTMITRSTASYQSIADQFSGILPATSADFLKQAQAAGFLAGSYKKLTDVPVAEYQEAVAKMLEKGTAALGLTGNTAAETASTFSGSFAAMKAAMSNFLGNLALGEDIGPSLNALAETVSTFLVGNLIPMVWNIVSALPGALVTFLQALIPGGMQQLATTATVKLSAYLRGALPTYLNNGLEIVTNLMNGFLSGIPAFLESAGSLLSMLLSSFLAALPSLWSTGFQLILNLVQGLISSGPNIVAAAVSLIGELLSTFAAHLPDLLAQGISLIGQLIAGLISMTPDIYAAGHDLTTTILKALSEVDWASVGVDIVLGIARGIVSARSAIIDAAKEAALSAYNAAKEALGIRSPSRLFRKEVGYRIPQGAALGVYDGISLLDRAMNDMSNRTNRAFASRLRLNGTPAGSGSGGLGRQIIINQYIYSEAKTAADLMREARYEAEKAVLLGV